MNAPDLAVPQCSEFVPASLHQYIDIILSRLVQQSLPEVAGIVTVRGRLADAGKPSGRMLYGAKLSDDTGAQVKLELPQSLLAGKGIRPGHQVCATGTLVVKSSNYGVEVKLSVSEIELLDELPPQTALTDSGGITLERLRSLPRARIPFPVCETITVDLVQSSSVQAQVALDCRAELEKVSDVLVINPRPINMLDPVAIAAAIATSSADILLIIRGGGDSADFSVFDDPRVLTAMAAQPAHRISGLGHTGNATLLDWLVDHSANTPAQAGAYIREVIEARRRERSDAVSELGRSRQAMADMAKNLAAAQAQAKIAGELLAQSTAIRGFPGWAIAAAGALGAGLVWLLRS